MMMITTTTTTTTTTYNAVYVQTVKISNCSRGMSIKSAWLVI